MNKAKSNLIHSRSYLCLLAFILASLVMTTTPVSAATTPPGHFKAAAYQTNTNIKGTITSLAPNSITITPSNSSPVTLTIDAQTRLLLYGILTLAIGQKADATYNSKTMITERITVNMPAPLSGTAKILPNKTIANVKGTISAVSGNYVSVNPSGGGTVLNIHFDSHTDITLYGVSSMAPGLTINAIYNTQTMVAERIMVNMSLPTPNTHSQTKQKFADVHGTISAVSGNYVSINPAIGGNLITLVINSDTDIMLNGGSSMAAGQTVNAIYFTTTLIAERIMVNVPLPGPGKSVPQIKRSIKVDGTISATSGNYVSINPSIGGNSITLTLNSLTDIFLNGVISMATGQKIIAVYNSQTMAAERISINGPLPPPGNDNNPPKAKNDDRDKDDRNNYKNDQRFQFNERMKEFYNWFLRFFHSWNNK